jgi:hypothetical protein
LVLLERSPQGEAEAEPNGDTSMDYTLRFFPSVLRKRYDSAPVSMMWAWSVNRIHPVSRRTHSHRLRCQTGKLTAQLNAQAVNRVLARMDTDGLMCGLKPTPCKVSGMFPVRTPEKEFVAPLLFVGK